MDDEEAYKQQQIKKKQGSAIKGTTKIVYVIDPKQRLEMEQLKQNEQEARTEVLRLQDVIRRSRVLTKFKEVVQNEKMQKKMDHLK